MRFERGAEVEEVFGEFGMGSTGVVARVLDDPFAHAESEVEAAPGRIALFEPRDDAEGVEIVVETEAILPQCGVEGFFAGVAEGGMTDVVGEGESFSEFAVQAEGCGESAGDLGDFKSVGEAAAEMVSGEVAGEAREDLGLSRQPAEGAGVENAGGVAREGRTIGMSSARDERGQRDRHFRRQQCGRAADNPVWLVNSSSFGLGLVISHKTGACTLSPVEDEELSSFSRRSCNGRVVSHHFEPCAVL